MSKKRPRSVANRNLRAVIDEQLTVAAHEIFRLLRERAQADVEQLKQLVTERVTAAVHIIFTVFETSRGADGGAEKAGGGGTEEPGESPGAPETQLTKTRLCADCFLCSLQSCVCHSASGVSLETITRGWTSRRRYLGLEPPPGDRKLRRRSARRLPATPPARTTWWRRRRTAAGCAGSPLTEKAF